VKDGAARVHEQVKVVPKNDAAQRNINAKACRSMLTTLQADSGGKIDRRAKTEPGRFQGTGRTLRKLGALEQKKRSEVAKGLVNVLSLNGSAV